MAMDEAIMLDVLRAITRVETKLDMMMQEDRAEDSMESESENPLEAMGAGGGSQQLSFEMPPFILY